METTGFGVHGSWGSGNGNYNITEHRILGTPTKIHSFVHEDLCARAYGPYKHPKP